MWKLSRVLALVVFGLTIGAVGFAGSVALGDDVVETGVFTARFDDGALTGLVSKVLGTLVRAPDKSQGLGIRRIDGDQWAAEAIRQSVELDEASGDLVVRQACADQPPGVWGVSWQIADIPLDYAIVVPGQSGVHLTPQTAGRREQFDYPLGWEAQLVIVEGPQGGFYVWADDTEGRYKRLLVERSADGWRLTLTTISNAPFDELTRCESVAWRLNVYQGDWRVPARRYRDWAERHFRPTPVNEQKPAWVKGIRCVVIMGLDTKMLAALPSRLDPRQTILYIFSWRAAGYDRDYPVYNEPSEKLRPFVEAAHRLGFRVMLHVNYFGVDPKNALYEQFGLFQVRDPFGNHDLKWWLWTRAEPEIRFAYINPAHEPWRKLFVERMVELCREYQIDSLHLDQTLCIYNDHNGLLDGTTMLQGNLLLHEEMRKALPEVALSGEGLNEVTYRYEAFAQRHAWGLNHAEGAWDRRRLAAAHPISSYLFRPYTIINGYLGCAPPTSGQLYAAWNEAYEHWGVIPTLKPTFAQIEAPTEFTRQFFDEVQFFQDGELTPEMEGDWPDDVAFAWRTADGDRAVRTTDGCFRCGDQLISRTITGVTEIETDGSIPHWQAYDSGRLIGLDPARWYPWGADPRPSDEFHVSALPAHAKLESIADWDAMAMVRVSSRSMVVADLVDAIDSAQGGSVPNQGGPFETRGPFVAEDGGKFELAADGVLSAHPPYKPGPSEGEATSLSDQDRERLARCAVLRYRVELPADGRLRFVSRVSMQEGTVGQENSDGVTFVVRAWSAADDKAPLHSEVHTAAVEQVPLELDLTPLAGRVVFVELSVHPGPDHRPSFDWARWQSPQIVRESATRDTIRVAGSDAPYSLLIEGGGSTLIEPGASNGPLTMDFPGSLFLMTAMPPEPKTPFDLASVFRSTVGLRHFVGYFDDTGRRLADPGITAMHASGASVGGVARQGIWAHPPDGGSATLHLPLRLPPQPVTFRTWVGIRDGSKSSGVVFRVCVNGRRVAEERVLPGGWVPIAVDLTEWQSDSIVLSLTTDSDGQHYYDWAHWGEPRVE